MKLRYIVPSLVLGFAVLFYFAWEYCFRSPCPTNPYRNSKPGDWISKRVVTKFQGKTFLVTRKESVRKILLGHVYVQIEEEREGKKSVPKETIISLMEPYGVCYPGPDNNAVTVNEGDEHLLVNGKDLPCHWTEYMINGSLSYKVWRSDSVPLSGEVKSRKYHQGTPEVDISSELVDYGFGQ